MTLHALDTQPADLSCVTAADEALAADAARPVRNPQLRGLQCLRCETLYPVSSLNDGCPACRRMGVHIGLRASYLPGTETGLPMPYLPAVSYTHLTLPTKA